MALGDAKMIYTGDCTEVLRMLPGESVHCVVTSPPFWGLRDYDVDGQLGLEPTPEQYVANLVTVFREVRRVLRKDGTVWLNLGSSYAKGGGTQVLQTKDASYGLAGYRHPTPSYAAKQLIPIPWLVALALQADGWWLRNDIIWAKGVSGQKETEAQILAAINRAFSPSMAKHVARKLLPELDLFVGGSMPESMRDRCTKSHEYVFLLAKSKRYFYDKWAIVEPAVGGTPGNKTHKGKTAYESGDERMRTKAGLCDMKAAKTRNRRSVWQINTKPLKAAHFATFPPDLIRPMILAGTSEKGVCVECGAPWKRILKQKAAVPKSCPKTDASYNARGGKGKKKTGTIGKSGGGRVDGYSKTIDWQPVCDCDHPTPIPATVLDPFFGAGTTGLVCEQLGRNWIGIELNPEYVKIARDRIEEMPK